MCSFLWRDVYHTTLKLLKHTSIMQKAFFINGLLLIFLTDVRFLPSKKNLLPRQKTNPGNEKTYHHISHLGKFGTSSTQRCGKTYGGICDRSQQGTLPETNGLPLKIGLPNRKVVFQPSIFRSHVSFRGCILKADVIQA